MEAQNNSSPGGYGNPWHHQEVHGKLHQQPTFSGGSSPSSRNPKSEYILCLNKAAAHMHWKFCKEFGIELKERWYEHEPKAVTEKDSVTTLWDIPIYTDRTIAANRPDIVLKNKKDKPCLIIDMITPLDSNTLVKTKEKLNKYKDLEIQVERMWELKTTTVPVVLGARGTIKRTWKTTPTKSLETSTFMNSRK